MAKEKYRIVSIPRQRRSAIDAGRLGRNKHIVHGLAEVDVTKVRQFIRTHEEETGDRLSFTAYIIYCLGRAVGHHPELHAYRNWRGQLVIFDDINITTMIEVEVAGRKVPMPYVFTAVNRKDYQEINSELRSVQSTPRESQGAWFMNTFLALPWLLRRPLYWLVMRVPQLLRDRHSSVMVTAVGMFSRGASWAITKPSQTLTMAIGGIAEKPGVVEGRIKVREYLHVTVSIDHDIVDGAPAARFGNELMGLIEEGYGLDSVR